MVALAWALVAAWTGSASASLKHMAAHGKDKSSQNKHHDASYGGDDSGCDGGGCGPARPHSLDAIDLDALPPGEAVSGPAKMVIRPAQEPLAFVMRAGYREYTALTPPWAADPGGFSAPSARAGAPAFLAAAETGVAAAKQALRDEYGAGHFADRIFGKAGERDPIEKGLIRVSNKPEEQLAKRVALALLSAQDAGQGDGQDAGPGRRFTVAFTGQSNAAGHGSYFDETYAFAMARAAAPAFKKAGLALAVQNFAVGGGRTLPTTGWCGRNQVGPAVDLAVWDFTMTEGGKTECQGEAWVRSMLTLPHPPAGLLFMDQSRAYRWGKLYKGHVAMLGVDGTHKGFKLEDNSTSLPPPMRFLHPDCRAYQKTHGEEANVLCRKDKWMPAQDMMQWKPDARSGKLQSRVYDPVTGRQLGGGCPGMNPWHDGWKLHNLKGAVLGHLLLRVLDRALAMLKRGQFQGGNMFGALKQELAAGEAKRRAAGVPSFGGDCKRTAHCNLVGELGCATGLHPSVLPPLRAVDSSGRAIPLSLDGANSGKRKDEATCRMGHLDHKFSVLVEPRHGWARVHLEGGIASNRALVVCEPPTGWKRDPKIAMLSEPGEVAFRLTGSQGRVTLDLKNPVPVDITKACYEFNGVSADALAGLRLDLNSTHFEVRAVGGKAVRFDHVVWHRGKL
eukprot:CAMPEP_0172590952 /NCGR_PEP_ID=MMETSP1068-20121228/9657_1 /TAXON_ID=35684 /ORGANISM="Pseudopedinella elastica, Strain CCMP716" /LENGTH=674 /DNA_ID=CAMNT_0013387151 /DNA_START=99 /DNA_END=2123 /DNA_ORIENTATION=+